MTAYRPIVEIEPPIAVAESRHYAVTTPGRGFANSGDLLLWLRRPVSPGAQLSDIPQESEGARSRP